MHEDRTGEDSGGGGLISEMQMAGVGAHTRTQYRVTADGGPHDVHPAYSKDFNTSQNKAPRIIYDCGNYLRLINMID